MPPFNVIVIFLWHSRFGRVLMEWNRNVPAFKESHNFSFATCLELEKRPVLWKPKKVEITNVKRLVRIGNITGRLSSEWLPRKAHQVSLIPQIHHKASHHRLQVGEMCSGTKLAQILQTCILWIFCLGKASIIFCPKHWWLKLGNMLQLPADLYLQINLN